MKNCFKCGLEKPRTEFYAHPRMADGLLGKCKACTRADVKAWYASTREQRSEYERRRHANPSRKVAVARYQRRGRERHPQRYAARVAVSNAVRDGRLKKQPCRDCGAKRVQAHHHDYSKPLDVTWLCFKCHREHEHGQVVTMSA